MEGFHDMRSGQRVGAVGRVTPWQLREVTVIGIVTGVYSLSSLLRELKVFSAQY